MKRGVLVLALALAAGGVEAAKVATIQNGSKVSIHYTLTVDQQVVDSSAGKTPLSYVQGSGQIIPGLEEQLAGLKRGDKRKVTVLPGKGYGPINPDAFQNVPKKLFQNHKELKVGNMVTGQQENGQMVRAKIVSMDKNTVTLDLNHPLAGKTLNFDVEVMDVQPAK